MTLFVVALVTVLVLEYHFDASVEIDLAMNYANDVQAYHLALAGVRFAQALLQQAPKDTNGLEDTWYKFGLVPACFSPQQLLELATTGLGDGMPTEGRDARRPSLSALPTIASRTWAGGGMRQSADYGRE
jgi:type II secretory pathway component PulK